MSDDREFNVFERRVRGIWEAVDVWGIEKGDIIKMNGDETKLWVCCEPRQTIDGHRGLLVDPYHGS